MIGQPELREMLAKAAAPPALPAHHGTLSPGPPVERGGPGIHQLSPLRGGGRPEPAISPGDHQEGIRAHQGGPEADQRGLRQGLARGIRPGEGVRRRRDIEEGGAGGHGRGNAAKEGKAPLQGGGRRSLPSLHRPRDLLLVPGSRQWAFGRLHTQPDRPLSAQRRPWQKRPPKGQLQPPGRRKRPRAQEKRHTGRFFGNGTSPYGGQTAVRWAIRQASAGLKCLMGKGGIGSLLEMNRPAVLRLKDEAARRLLRRIDGARREEGYLCAGG